MPSMTKASVPPNRGAEQIKRLLASPEVAALIVDLEATRFAWYQTAKTVAASVGRATAEC